jgi:hypothetical protein
MRTPALHLAAADQAGRYPWRGQLASRCQLTLHGLPTTRVRGQLAPGGIGI